MKDLLKKKKLEEMQLVTVEEEMKKWDTKGADHGLLKVLIHEYPLSNPLTPG